MLTHKKINLKMASLILPVLLEEKLKKLLKLQTPLVKRQKKKQKKEQINDER